MQVTVEEVGTLGRKLTVQLPSSEIEQKVSDRLKEIGKTMKMKGFRPGKIPFAVVKKRFGGQVRQEIAGELIQHSFAEAVSDEKLRPAGVPEITADPLQENADLQFTAAFDVMPELDAIDVGELVIERPMAEVADEDVEEMLETLRKQRMTWLDVDQASTDGDLVYFHFSAEIDGNRVPVEGEEAAGAILGQGALGEEFERHLLELKSEDEKRFEATFPEQFRNTELAGKTGTIAVRVEKVQQAQLPEIDQAFAEAFGVTGGVEELRTGVRENLERELKQGLSRRTREIVINQLRTQYPDIEIPVSLIKNEINILQQQSQQQAQQMGQPNAPLPDAEGLRGPARQRVHSAVLVSEIARHAGIELDETRVRDAILEVASTYEDPQSVINLYFSDQRLLTPIQNLILEEQAVDWVLDHAKVHDKGLSFSEVMQQPDGEN